MLKKGFNAKLLLLIFKIILDGNQKTGILLMVLFLIVVWLWASPGLSFFVCKMGVDG